MYSLMFADDLLVCGQATQHEAITISNTLQRFCTLCGQTPNWAKSSIIFSKNVINAQRDIIKGIFRVVDMNNSRTHLGHPLIMPAKNRAQVYNFVLDQLKSKLNGYKANKLSHAARLVLIKSVFASLPVYYMSNILFSKKTLAKMNVVIWDFWWTGVQDENQTKPLYLTAWAEIYKSKKEAGLGIETLEGVNKALLVNAAWRIVTTPDSNTSRILQSKYYPYSSFWKATTNTPKSAFWTSILKVRETLANAVTL